MLVGKPAVLRTGTQRTDFIAANLPFDADFDGIVDAHLGLLPALAAGHGIFLGQIAAQIFRSVLFQFRQVEIVQLL
ncbi:hypothetical protein D3C76_1594600 [compost metagenome]